MRLDLSELRAHLKRGLEKLYVVHGDELLLTLEASDLIRRACRANEFEERTVLVAESRFDWTQLKDQALAISLFSSKKLVDLRIPGGKPGKAGSDALQNYVQNLPEDVVTLITLPGLDRNTKNAKWFSALEKAGTSIEVKKVYKEQLPSWINQRLKSQNQTADRDAVQLLADRVEGNLVSAKQEILKLGLLLPQGHLTLDDVRDAVVDIARFEAFDLGAAILKGDKAVFARTLKGLEREGVAPPLVLWVITEEARVMLRVKYALDSGMDMRSALSEAGALGLRQKLLPGRVNQISVDTLQEAIIQAANVDKQIKGLLPGNPWEQLLIVGLSLIG